MSSIGNINQFQQFGAGNHNWAAGMNANMLKAATSLHLTAKSFVTALPGGPSNSDCYIHSGTGIIHTYVNGWHEITPVIGTLAFIDDEDCFYLYARPGQWELLVDLDAPLLPAVERNLSFYAPGLLRPSANLFHFVPTMEFAIPQNAPNSFAVLEEPPSGGNLVLSIIAPGGNGTITFANGSVDGVISMPNRVVVLPSEWESIYSSPQILRITSPNDTLGAEGLTVSLKGEIRSID